MKHFLNFFALLSLIVALNYPIVEDWKWIDDRTDKTQTYFVLIYTDGSEDRILMKQTDVGTPEMYKAIDKVVEHKEQTWHVQSK